MCSFFFFDSSKTKCVDAVDWTLKIHKILIHTAASFQRVAFFFSELESQNIILLPVGMYT